MTKRMRSPVYLQSIVFPDLGYTRLAQDMSEFPCAVYGDFDYAHACRASHLASRRLMMP